VPTDQTHVTLVSKSSEPNNHATNASLAQVTKFQMLKEPHVLTDHLLTVVALKEEMFLDTNASNAQLDKLLIQTTLMPVLLSQLVLNYRSNSQETTPTVLDAKHAPGQHRSQITPEPDVSRDQRPTVIALKEELIVDTNVPNAQSDKLPIDKTSTILTTITLTPKLVLPQQHVLVPMPSNLQSQLPNVEDAKTATGQEKFQINKELLVSQDQLSLALTALPDNQMTDTHAKNAQLDQFNQLLIHNNAILQPVTDNMMLEALMTNSTVEDVSLATGQFKCQMHQELHASTDHLPLVLVALLDNQMMDTHALHAQLVLSEIALTQNSATDHNAMDNMISNSQLTKTLVEDAKLAHGQDKFQTTRELLVSSDQLLNAQTA
jgi:hypothetical protein